MNLTNDHEIPYVHDRKTLIRLVGFALGMIVLITGLIWIVTTVSGGDDIGDTGAAAYQSSVNLNAVTDVIGDSTASDQLRSIAAATKLVSASAQSDLAVFEPEVIDPNTVLDVEEVASAIQSADISGTIDDVGNTILLNALSVALEDINALEERLSETSRLYESVVSIRDSYAELLGKLQLPTEDS